eukprot:3209352-Prymnesium_polylepis.2
MHSSRACNGDGSYLTVEILGKSRRSKKIFSGLRDVTTAHARSSSFRPWKSAGRRTYSCNVQMPGSRRPSQPTMLPASCASLSLRTASEMPYCPKPFCGFKIQNCSASCCCVRLLSRALTTNASTSPESGWPLPRLRLPSRARPRSFAWLGPCRPAAAP